MKTFLFLSISCCLLSCSSRNQQVISTGLAKIGFETFFSTSFPPFSTSSLIWYRDSSIIMEIGRVRFESKNGGPSVRKDTIMHYLYIDLMTNSFYQYGSFTDTATLQKSYWQPDSLYIDGGWNFYYDKNVIILSKPESISDTVINNIVFKRIRYVSEEDKINGSFSIGYIRCDRGRSMFSREKYYSDSIGCQMSMIESYDSTSKNKQMLTKTEFLRDSLNAKEIKVFDVWEKYAKNNPPKEKRLGQKKR